MTSIYSQQKLKVIFSDNKKLKVTSQGSNFILHEYHFPIMIALINAFVNEDPPHSLPIGPIQDRNNLVLSKIVSIPHVIYVLI